MSEECCFSFITLLDSDVVIPPVDVHNWEFGASTEAVNDLRNERGHILVLLCPFIYRSVVLYWL